MGMRSSHGQGHHTGIRWGYRWGYRVNEIQPHCVIAAEQEPEASLEGRAVTDLRGEGCKAGSRVEQQHPGDLGEKQKEITKKSKEEEWQRNYSAAGSVTHPFHPIGPLMPGFASTLRFLLENAARKFGRYTGAARRSKLGRWAPGRWVPGKPA
ncbi:hypothetical protein SKAU_G00363450 [Synaphobranchus kaupii]|uniref:Uncharacterized protein n=1 Tax=Synaphobranchus kaupii TaxID=118154 RepID=A0A9Q1EIP9_SYNKA|nr:hypothetical protein SKAU_G00363450 [Synaphobranchus kaupii]